MKKMAKAAITSLFNGMKKIRKNQAGNVGIMFGLSAIPIFLAAGSAIDYSRIANAKSNLVAGLDAAALYGAAITGKTEAEMKELSRTYLDQNYKNTGDAAITAFDFHNYADRVEVTGSVQVKTWFMSVGGITSVAVPAESQIMKAGNSIEVSLVLDVTGSMNDSVGGTTKIASLRAAANSFVDTVVWSNQTPYYSKVGIIPFSIGVNVGALADSARGTLTAATCTTPGCTTYRFNNGGNTYNYVATNCVSERIGSAAYTDAAVSGAKVGRLYDSSVTGCNGIQPVVPLTNDKTVLHNTINALVATGGTAGQIGMAWGWYMISPTFGLWSGSSIPAAYPAEGTKLKKIAIFMTDGDFNVSYCNGLRDGYVCPATNGDETVQAQTLCNAMKAKDITVYTIGFDLSGATAVNFMHNCASDASKAFDAANQADLNAAFASIAQNLLELRVSK